MSELLYRLDGVARRAGDSFTLRVDRLEVFAGEVLCLVGPTGAGKTTLLRLLTGLDLPDAGAAWFDGAPLGPAAGLARLRRIAMAHQKPLLLAGSVRYNVGYGLRARGVAPRERAERLIRRLGLGRQAGQDARTLSGGQAQLVALARALAPEPDVLLLDEPTANLDPARVALAEGVVAEERAARELTVVWATHNLFQARRVADRVALLLDGRLVETADVGDFFERPADLRKAAFVERKMIH